MMELVDMPGVSAKFRICKMQTANFKTAGGALNGNFCAPKLGVPRIPVGDRFCMRGGALREKAPYAVLLYHWSYGWIERELQVGTSLGQRHNLVGFQI